MGKLIKATHEGDLTIGDKTLSCAVLSDGTRVMTASAVFDAFERPRKGKSSEEYRADQMPSFINANNLQPFVTEDIRGWTELIEYKTPSGAIKTGYNARLLRGLCKVYIDARNAGEIKKSQERFALISEALLYALADIGITALVDEATGYQYDREAQELQSLLKAYVSEELLVWQKRFPDVFYQEIFRLNGWAYTVSDIKKRPGVIGTWTNNLIYKQLPSGVLDELKKQTPKNSKGNSKHRFHQLLTLDVGHADLQRQLSSVITIMKLSKNWKDFMGKFNQLYGQVSLDFEDIDDAIIVEPKKLDSKFDKSLKTALDYNPKEDKE